MEYKKVQTTGIYYRPNLITAFYQFQNHFYLKIFPNPFGSFTTISYSVPAEGEISLTICNLLGIPIKTLINEFQTQGEYRIDFSPGSKLPDGVYFVHLSLNGKLMETRKMILVK